jgi:hypothetical protein
MVVVVVEEVVLRLSGVDATLVKRSEHRGVFVRVLNWASQQSLPIDTRAASASEQLRGRQGAEQRFSSSSNRLGRRAG